MDNSVKTESLPALPADYWEIQSPAYGALVENLSGEGAFLISNRDMAVGKTLNALIFYANEYELDGIKAVGTIISKHRRIEEEWKGYRYGLQFIEIPEQDGLKLKTLLNGHSTSGETSGREIVPLKDPSLPPSPNSGSTIESIAKCSYYDNGKCLKTRAFCDLCHDEDKTVLMSSTIKNGGRRRSKRWTSWLAR